MSKKQKAIVLLSSGLDSTVNLYESVKNYEVVMALTFNYGQRAAQKEIAHSKKLCETLGINHKLLDLSWFKDFTQTSLVNQENDVPTGLSVQIDNMNTSQNTAHSVWVPNRNGIFLNIAAGFCEGLKAKYVVVGFNYEEAQTFPDNSEAYLKQMNQCFQYSTENKVQLICYTLDKNKTQIYNMALSNNIDLNMIWPCYFGEEEICAECESCLRFLRAQAESEVGKIRK